MFGSRLSQSLIDAASRCASGDNQSDSCKRVDEAQLDETLKIKQIGRTTKITNKQGDVMEIFSNPGKTLSFSFTIKDGNEFAMRGDELEKFKTQMMKILGG